MEKNESPLLVGSAKTTQFATPNSLKCKTNKYFQLFPVINTNTPPPRMRVRNPFEMFERLHLPACSPLLLQRPSSRSTPQRSSDHFEWTIDEISTMKPVHLEPHDTQFQTPHDYDSETEARAQAAIITYFNEHEIVPSPIDCQLRNQKLVLPEELMDTSHASLSKAKPKAQSADGTAQTILTFPPILPKSVEDLLKPFFCYNADQQQSPNDCDRATKDYYEARDASLRRKLFATDDCSETSSVGPANTSIEIDFDAISPAPQTPELDLNLKSRINYDNHLEGQTLTVPIDALSPIRERRESFGALSPIVRTGESSESIVETPPSPGGKQHSGATSDSSIYRSTPGKRTSRDELSMSIDDVPRTAASKVLATSLNNIFGDPVADWELSSHEDSICNYLTQEETTTCIDAQPNTSLDFYRPEEHNTPLRPRTQTSRKNLSRSFNMLTNFSDDEEADMLPEVLTQQRTKKSKSFTATFRRMDSGFNDDYSSSQPSMERIKPDGDELDISMQSQDENRLICSTPSDFF